MKIGSLIKDALILFAITLVLGIALSSAKVITQPAVDKAALESKMKAFNAVCTGYNTSEDLSADFVGFEESFNDFSSKARPTIRFDKNGKEGVLRVLDASNNPIGYIVQVGSKGFGGALKIIVGFDVDGKVTGVQYAETPSETPGVGMKTTKASFLGSWLGKSSTDVNSVDTISGATVSSTAFKDAVKLACAVVDVAKNK